MGCCDELNEKGCCNNHHGHMSEEHVEHGGHSFSHNKLGKDAKKHHYINKHFNNNRHRHTHNNHSHHGWVASLTHGGNYLDRLKQALVVLFFIAVFTFFNLPFKEEALLLLSIFMVLFPARIFFEHAVHEIKSFMPGMMSLISLALLGALMYGIYSYVFDIEDNFYLEIALLVVVMLIGHHLEDLSVKRSLDVVETLVSSLPKRVAVYEGGRIIQKNLQDIYKGNVVLVRKGEMIPSDGFVIDGKGYVSESLVTGEEMPLLKKKGDSVIGGSILKEGTIKVKLSVDPKHSYIYKIVEMVKKADKPKIMVLADKIAMFLFYAALFFSLYAFFFSPSIEEGIRRALAVLVIACPHALGLAIPLVVYRASAIAGKRGILIYKKDVFERFPKANILIFDKTGTLTDYSLTIEEMHIKGDKSIYLSILKHSSHPVALSISKYLDEKENEKYVELSSVKEIEGKGMVATVGKDKYIVGNLSLIRDYNVSVDVEADVYFAKNNKLMGYVKLKSSLKKSSYDVVNYFKKFYEIYIVSGDKKKNVEKVAKELGVKFMAEVKPEEKYRVVEHFQKQGNKVVFVGDGINDAPSLAKADVGIAVSKASDIAISSSDVVVRDINVLIDLHKISVKSYRKMRENVLWAVLYNAITIPITAGMVGSIFIPPALASLIMAFSTIVVTFNTFLLK